VRAAEWNFTWEVGSPWRTVVRRRDLTGIPLPLTEPCRLEIREMDSPSTAEPLLTLTGVLNNTDVDNQFWSLGATSAETRTLGAGRFEHTLWIGVAAGEPELWSRGYLQARDRAGDQG
jgi:hypothetical protein